MSNITSCDSGSFSTENTVPLLEDAVVKQQSSEILGGRFHHSPHSHTSTTTTNNNNNSTNASNTNSQPPPPPPKKKRNLPGNPDPSAEVIALSPTTLMATNRFICEICNKGFQRDQNLQLHRRGHNLPWKLKQRTSAEVRKRVYVCPESSCVHHNPARALGDLTGIKKHFCRKHGEKKWKCDKCSKKYAVQSDWKAHSKICGTREYKCDCGTIFSRRDSFITHRAFCDALAEENNNNKNEGSLFPNIPSNLQSQPQIPNLLLPSLPITTTPTTLSSSSSLPLHHDLIIPKPSFNNIPFPRNPNTTTTTTTTTSHPSLQLTSTIFDDNALHLTASSSSLSSPHMSATALLQKAAQMGATVSSSNNNMVVENSNKGGGYVTATTSMAPPSFSGVAAPMQQNVNNNNNSLFMNQFMQQDMATTPHHYGNLMCGMNGVDMFNAILDQSKALSKIIDHSNHHRESAVAKRECTKGGSIGGNSDVMTLDLLGIGGGGGGGHNGSGGFYGGGNNNNNQQQGDNNGAASVRDEVWNWSTKNAGFESFSATSSI
ncbi:zinc finger protein GAI-ASSOCIATED FACTOR 1-like [Arachis stenosperma]|uniref:zinc finger protein GAI-ASSOCIATED FACTOR 1-like n=1 Tax=Arachis stenosperma TaxID=217475 RepID=UPI0025ACEB7E|nr:zinc finger protein GAI-ASSOCIATED FACTOR 1-like [Arachis stenosperma]